MNRKIKCFKQCFCRAVLEVTAGIRSAVIRPWHRPTVVYCPVDNTLFNVSPGIRCLGVWSRYCCFGNHAANL